MKLLWVALLLASASCQSVDDVCARDITKEFAPTAVGFDTRLYKAAARYYNNHFVISQYSTWLTLAGIAEGASEATQEKLFDALYLPKQVCLRAKFYKSVRKHEKPCTDLKTFRRRFLAYDESLTLNTTWLERVTNAGLLTAVSAPLKSNPDLAEEILSSKANTVLKDMCFPGNSILLDTFDYSGLWSSAFPNAKIERNVPFLNEAGEKIAKVDMLRVKRRTRFAYVPELGIKMVEFPIDKKKHYSLVIFTTTDSTSLDSPISMLNHTTIEQLIFLRLKESLVPIEVAFPMFKITTYHDNLEDVLERVGLWSIFNDPSATEYVSQPPALPGQYIQRISVTIDVDTDDYVHEETVYSEAETGLPKELSSAFVVNKPFVFALLDSRTKVCVFSGAYSQPNYPYA